MAALQENMNKLVEELKQQRDELKLKMHLGKAEAKEEWEKLEQQLEGLEEKLDAKKGALSEVVDEASDNVEAALEMAADEIKKGYARLRDLF